MLLVEITELEDEDDDKFVTVPFDPSDSESEVRKNMMRFFEDHLGPAMDFEEFDRMRVEAYYDDGSYWLNLVVFSGTGPAPQRSNVCIKMHETGLQWGVIAHELHEKLSILLDKVRTVRTDQKSWQTYQKHNAMVLGFDSPQQKRSRRSDPASLL